MGHFLRCGLSRRLGVLLHDSSVFKDRNNIQKIGRPLSTGIPRHKDNEFDENLLEDLSKFDYELKTSLPKSKLKLNEFVPGPADSPDAFGTLSKENTYILNHDKGTEEDQIEENFSFSMPNYLPQKEYLNMVKKFLRRRQFAEALDVLNVTMLKEHRVKPQYHIYAILITFCGYNGYHKMATKLYYDMKRKDLFVPASVHTALFNSYANSPFPSHALVLTRNLFAQLTETGKHPNQITCHAIIKAFGRCGSVEEAFKTVDYMMTNQMAINPETMSFLFQACISDREAGLRHALLVYRKMLQYNLKMDVIHFNLFLRCIRSCGFGDMESTMTVLRELGVENCDELFEKQTKPYSLDTGYAWEEDEAFSAMVITGSTEPQVINGLPAPSEKNVPTSLMPNLFSRKPTLGCVVSLAEMETPQDRLFLFGGVSGFIEEMSKHDAKPDIKTITQMLDCIPDSCTAETSFIKILKKFKVQPDLLLFNTIILRRIKRRQYSEAKDVLPLMAAYGFQPDLMTYVNLAMSCRTLTEAYELLKVMDASGLRPSIELVTALVGCAVGSYQIKYVDFVLEIIEYEEMEVNDRFIGKLDNFYAKCSKVLKLRDSHFGPTHLDAIANFCKRYPRVKASFRIEKPRHPWKQFHEKQEKTSETDDKFLAECVEPNAVKPKFPRLHSNTAPKVQQAKWKQFKEQKPGTLKRSQRPGALLSSLQGIDSIQYQQLAPKQL